MTSTPLKHTPENAESPESEPADESPAGDTGDGSPTEVGGREGPDPTRYGDWEKNGRCIDF